MFVRPCRVNAIACTVRYTPYELPRHGMSMSMYVVPLVRRVRTCADSRTLTHSHSGSARARVAQAPADPRRRSPTGTLS